MWGYGGEIYAVWPETPISKRDDEIIEYSKPHRWLCVHAHHVLVIRATHFTIVVVSSHLARTSPRNLAAHHRRTGRRSENAGK